MIEMKDKVQGLETWGFNVNKVPPKVYKEFTDFCKIETSSNYAFGIKVLLERSKAYELLINEIAEMKLQIQEFDVKPEIKKAKIVKTLGSGGIENE